MDEDARWVLGSSNCGLMLLQKLFDTFTVSYNPFMTAKWDRIR